MLSASEHAVPEISTRQASTEDRIAKLEENQQLAGRQDRGAEPDQGRECIKVSG